MSAKYNVRLMEIHFVFNESNIFSQFKKRTNKQYLKLYGFLNNAFYDYE